MEQHRPQTARERELFGRLLGRTFPGRDELKVQLDDAVVRSIDKNGGLEIRVLHGPNAGVSRRVAVEAECADGDGIKIHYLLHVVDGIAQELEVYKEDGSQVISTPPISTLEVM